MSGKYPAEKIPDVPGPGNYNPVDSKALGKSYRY
jgi:hypothetical protein